MGLLPCRCVVVPAPGAAAGGVPSERCVGRLHLRHLLLCLAQPAPRASREPPLLDIALLLHDHATIPCKLHRQHITQQPLRHRRLL